jgi:hypothetical protein
MKKLQYPRIYTHKDATGMPWRFEGSRPISMFGDKLRRMMDIPEGHDIKETPAHGVSIIKNEGEIRFLCLGAVE